MNLAGGALGFALLAAGGLLGLKDGARLHVLLGCTQRYLAHTCAKAQRAHALPITGLLCMTKNLFNGVVISNIQRPVQERQQFASVEMPLNRYLQDSMWHNVFQDERLLQIR